MDKINKFLAYNGRINVICCNTTTLVEEARKIHDLSPVVTAALGRLLTVTSLMATDLKNKEDKLTIQIKANGPIESMVTVANSNNEVKGYAKNTVVDMPLNEDGKLDVGGAVGFDGFINVIKDIGLKEPYVGMVPLVSGEIGDDFANYFVKSEGQDAAVAVGVLVDKNGVKSAGGYIIKPMPDATNEDISNLEQNIFKAGAISKMLDEKLSLEEIAKKITGDEDIKLIEDYINPKYQCDCNRNRFERGLISLGKEELKKLIETQDKIETTCQFCNKKYEFTKQEIEELLK